MNSSLAKRQPKFSQVSSQAWLGSALLAATFVYIWVLPLFRPRGDFLWGLYRLKDIYLGIPVGLATLCAMVVLVVPTRYRRPLALRLTTLCIFVVMLLFVCDFGYTLRVLRTSKANFWLRQAFIPEGYSAADNELGFVRKPSASWRGYIPGANRIVDYRTDENGFRNDFGVRRADIVFIGDSFTEAATVTQDETFVRRVAAASKLSAVNLGRGAYGPQQELIVLQRYGLAYHPRIVVWQLFEGNDLTDANIFAAWRKDPQQTTTSLKERYFNNSLISEWLSKTRLPDPGVPRVALRYLDGTAKQVVLRYEYDANQPARIPVGFAETMQAIEAGYRLCRSQGIQLEVLFVPTMVRVMEPYVTFRRAEDQVRYFPNGSRNDKTDFSGRTAEFCAQLGCPFLDTFVALRQAAATDNRNLYIPNDEHLDFRGHEIIAQTILEWLHSQAIVGQRPE